VPNLYYQHPGTWFGDCMPIYARGAYYLFHQRDTRRPGPFGEPFGWALARTTDFVVYEDFGDVLPRGEDSSQDQFVFAGSVFEANGSFYAAYTGYNRDYAAHGKPAQVLMLAASDDLLDWHKTGRRVVVPQPGYDPNNWRDPFVLRDDEHDRWVMILGSRLAGERVLTGRTVWFTSTDLETWDFHGDFWAPDLYSMHEMPDLFRIGDWWYLLTTEYSDRSKTVYRTSRSMFGPWSAPVDDAFDGRAYYAARSASDGTHRYLFGWVPTKAGDTDLGAQQWGGTLVVHEVLQRPDGSLGVGLPAGVSAAFNGQPAPTAGELELSRADGRAELSLGDVPGPTYCIRARFRVTAETRGVAFELARDPATGDAYAFTIYPGEQRLVFDKVPNYPWFRYDNRGQERPLRLDPARTHDVCIVVDGSIATIYVDDVALNARMYDQRGASIAASVVDGTLTLTDVTIAALG